MGDHLSPILVGKSPSICILLTHFLPLQSSRSQNMPISPVSFSKLPGLQWCVGFLKMSETPVNPVCFSLFCFLCQYPQTLGKSFLITTRLKFHFCFCAWPPAHIYQLWWVKTFHQNPEYTLWYKKPLWKKWAKRDKMNSICLSFNWVLQTQLCG